jgi:nucleotide-binding universal stress UspA family protein
MTNTKGPLRLMDAPTDTPNDATYRTAAVIVVGVDGSPTSWDAFTWAAGEATRTHGRLIAVYVAPTVEPGAEFGAPIDFGAAELARDEIVAALKTEVEDRARSFDIQVAFAREIGDPATALTRFSKSVEADLIVVGKSTKMFHRLAGSLGRRLVSRHDCPAIVVVP